MLVEKGEIQKWIFLNCESVAINFAKQNNLPPYLLENAFPPSRQKINGNDKLTYNLINNFLFMKKSFVLLVIFLLTILSLQAQDANVISTMRIGIFKLKMTIADVEKAMEQKIKVKHKQDNYFDTVKLMYNQANYTLSFVKRYNEIATAPEVWELYAVSSANTTLKTKSGMGLGNTKTEILSVYDKNDITITNDWAYKEKGNAKDKIQFVTLNDYDAGTTLIFKTEDRVVKSIEVRLYEGD